MTGREQASSPGAKDTEGKPERCGVLEAKWEKKFREKSFKKMNADRLAQASQYPGEEEAMG